MDKQKYIANSIELPFLSNVGLVLTYKCQVSCPHCIIEAGPNRKEVMKPDDAFSWINQISNFNNGSVKFISLTGGEPFYNLRNLKEISEHAQSKGLWVSAVTNAFWASSKEKAIKILNDLKAIRLLSISTDKYHLSSIPLERIQNAVYAATKYSIPYNISVCTENLNDPDYKILISRLEKFCEKESINSAITYFAGRAATNSSKKMTYNKVPNPPISACSSAKSPIIFPDGKVIACIGPIIALKKDHPLILGNLRDNTLSEIFEKAEMNPILHAIRVWGPRKLIEILKEEGMSKFLPNAFIRDSICNTCFELFSNSKLTEYFENLSINKEFIEKVAYARTYYLNEQSMIKPLLS